MMVKRGEYEHRKALNMSKSRLALVRAVGSVCFLAAVMFLAASVPSVFAEGDVKLTILHTNDLHGIMLPFEKEGQMVGGMSRISALVEQVRQQEENVLLVDAGDTIMEDRHVMANYFRGEHVIKIMNEMAFDIAVPGNHDFEFGLDILAERIAQADFQYLAANIVPTENPTESALLMTSQMEPYVIVSVQRVRIGFLGLTMPLHGFSGIEILETLETAREYVPRMREEADIVIVMTHQKLERDYEIVDQVDGIDILFAAHVHKVKFEHGLMRNGTLIVKTSCWGKELGRVDLTVEEGPDGFHLKEAQAALIYVTSELPEDEVINEIMQPYVDETRRYQTRLVITLVTVFLALIGVVIVFVRRFLNQQARSGEGRQG